MTPAERKKISFNLIACLLAALLGPVHYLRKGLWRQAITYFAVTLAIVLLLSAFDINPRTSLAFGMAIVYAAHINVSYYQKVALGQAPWF